MRKSPIRIRAYIQIRAPYKEEPNMNESPMHCQPCTTMRPEPNKGQVWFMAAAAAAAAPQQSVLA